MNTGQKVVLRQLQLAGLGIIFLVAGWLAERMELVGIGVATFLYGSARALFLYKIMKESEE